MAVGTYALTTLSGVKDYMGGLDGETDVDSLIESLIDQTSAIFETYIDKNILSREYTEYYDGGDGVHIFPKQYPITIISGIWDDIDWVWADTTLVASTDYRIHNNNKYIVFKTTTLFDYDQNVKLIYTAGYTTIPEDIELCCIKEVARSYKHRRDVDVISSTLADGSVNYVAKSLLPNTKMILNKYKRISLN